MKAVTCFACDKMILPDEGCRIQGELVCEACSESLCHECLGERRVSCADCSGTGEGSREFESCLGCRGKGEVRCPECGD